MYPLQIKYGDRDPKEGVTSITFFKNTGKTVNTILEKGLHIILS